jgi:hypothetical protein
MFKQIKAKKGKIVKLFFTGIELALILGLLGGGALGINSYAQKRSLKKASEQNAKQAETINELAKKVEEVNKQKDNVVDELQQNQQDLKSKASTGFSVLYEQAKDIKTEQPSTFASVHVETAKKYVEAWGYDAMAQVIKWQQDQIEKQIVETKALMLREKVLTEEYLNYKVKTQEEIFNTKKEAEKHKTDAQTLSSKVNEYMGENSWLQQLTKILIIGSGIYLFVTFGGIPLFFMFKRRAVEAIQAQLEVEKKKKGRTISAIKAFKAANDDGNDTMDKMLIAHKVFLDSEDEEDHKKK